MVRYGVRSFDTVSILIFSFFFFVIWITANSISFSFLLNWSLFSSIHIYITRNTYSVVSLFICFVSCLYTIASTNCVPIQLRKTENVINFYLQNEGQKKRIWYEIVCLVFFEKFGCLLIVTFSVYEFCLPKQKKKKKKKESNVNPSRARVKSLYGFNNIRRYNNNFFSCKSLNLVDGRYSIIDGGWCWHQKLDGFNWIAMIRSKEKRAEVIIPTEQWPLPLLDRLIRIDFDTSWTLISTARMVW